MLENILKEFLLMISAIYIYYILNMRIGILDFGCQNIEGRSGNYCLLIR